MQKLLGDNVQWYTLASIIIPALAVIFVGLNLLIRDGAEVPSELQYLEQLGLIGAGLHGAWSVIHTIFANRRAAQRDAAVAISQSTAELLTAKSGGGSSTPSEPNA